MATSLADLFPTAASLAVVSWAPDSGESLTLTAAMNTHYQIDLSGLTADATLTLPAPTSVQQAVSLYIEVGDLDYLLKIAGGTGVVFMATTGAEDPRFRLYTTGESLIIRPLADLSGWYIRKHEDGRIPGSSRMQAGGTNDQDEQTVGGVSGTWANVGNYIDQVGDVGFTHNPGTKTDPSADPSYLKPRRKMGIEGIGYYVTDLNTVGDPVYQGSTADEYIRMFAQCYDYNDTSVYGAAVEAIKVATTNGQGTRLNVAYSIAYPEVTSDAEIGVRFQASNFTTDVGSIHWNTSFLYIKEVLI